MLDEVRCAQCRDFALNVRLIGRLAVWWPVMRQAPWNHQRYCLTLSETMQVLPGNTGLVEEWFPTTIIASYQPISALSSAPLGPTVPKYQPLCRDSYSFRASTVKSMLEK